MDSEDWLLIGGLLGAFVVMCFFFVGGAMLWDSHVCQARANKMSMRSSWTLAQGCMIEYRPGKWIDIDRYRAFDD